MEKLNVWANLTQVLICQKIIIGSDSAIKLEHIFGDCHCFYKIPSIK